MFVDIAEVLVQAGNGGSGVISFRHEKFVDRGGPDGGDGGKGGDVIFEASNSEDTLAQFRHSRIIRAEDGDNGRKQRQHGKNGISNVVRLPVGTVVKYENQTIADLTLNGQRVVVARGGLGGYGNAHFVSSVRQAPRIAEKGEQGQQRKLVLELKMIADVGLVGLPNAGKSTFLSVVSNARPKIADYPFTTLQPNLGVVDIDNQSSMLFADIPGLIEGASSGRGLGDDFLRHVERTKVLLHLIDIYSNDVVSDYQTISRELSQYRVDLTKRPQIVALTKIEGIDEKELASKMQSLREALSPDTTLMAISSVAGTNVKKLLHKLHTLIVQQTEVVEATSEDEDTTDIVIRLEGKDVNAWGVKRENGKYYVSGEKIERFAMRTDFSNPEGVARLQDIMRKMGILHELLRQGATNEDEIMIGTYGPIRL
jgi:GTPase